MRFGPLPSMMTFDLLVGFDSSPRSYVLYM